MKKQSKGIEQSRKVMQLIDEARETLRLMERQDVNAFIVSNVHIKASLADLEWFTKTLSEKQDYFK